MTVSSHPNVELRSCTAMSDFNTTKDRPSLKAAGGSTRVVAAITAGMSDL